MRPRWLFALGFILALTVPAVADAHVNAHAARVRHLKARVAAVMPSAQAQVQAAAAAGPAALTALVNKVDAMPLAAPATTTPTQYALLSALQPYTSGSEDSGVVSDALDAHASAACWYQGNHIWHRWDYTEAGVKVAYAEKDHGYWCGNGSSITDSGGSNWGYYHKIGANPPFCTVTTFNVNGWDAPNHAWAHGGLSTHMGTYTPWTTCLTYAGSSVGLRIAANGHWDAYWDF
jgi:hypothetical protein